MGELCFGTTLTNMDTIITRRSFDLSCRTIYLGFSYLWMQILLDAFTFIEIIIHLPFTITFLAESTMLWNFRVLIIDKYEIAFGTDVARRNVLLQRTLIHILHLSLWLDNFFIHRLINHKSSDQLNSANIGKVYAKHML